jgi:hypothetical protein
MELSVNQPAVVVNYKFQLLYEKNLGVVHG